MACAPPNANMPPAKQAFEGKVKNSCSKKNKKNNLQCNVGQHRSSKPTKCCIFPSIIPFLRSTSIVRPWDDFLTSLFKIAWRYQCVNNFLWNWPHQQPNIYIYIYIVHMCAPSTQTLIQILTHSHLLLHSTCLLLPYLPWKFQATIWGGTHRSCLQEPRLTCELQWI